MPTPNGPHNQPRFDLNDDPDFAADLTAVSDFAASVGFRKGGPTTSRTAASGNDVWDGLEWYDTTDGNIYLYKNGQWVPWETQWADFTAQFTGFSGGTTVTAKMRRTRGRAEVIYVWRGGSNLAVGNVSLIPPITPAAWVPSLFPLGKAQLVDATAGVGGYVPAVALYVGGGARMHYYRSTSDSDITVPVTASNPFAYAVNDQIMFELDYPIDV